MARLTLLVHEQWLTQFCVVDYVEQHGAPLRTDAAFVIEDGNPVTSWVERKPALVGLIRCALADR